MNEFTRRLDIIETAVLSAESRAMALECALEAIVTTLSPTTARAAAADLDARSKRWDANLPTMTTRRVDQSEWRSAVDDWIVRLREQAG